ncbi:MAG: hypothetical protein ABL958_20280, partial [Bdellovibrionia bacterium]
QLLRWPVEVSGRELFVDVRGALWSQPKDQLYDGEHAEGGLVSVRAIYPVRDSIETYVRISGKSAGWVPGILSLEPEGGFLAGVIVAL